MTIRPELLDELLKDYQNPQDLLGEDGIIKQLTKAMIERCPASPNWKSIWAIPSMDVRVRSRAMHAMARTPRS